MTITKEVYQFLKSIQERGGAATSRSLGCVVDRAEDRARQKACKSGLASYTKVGPFAGRKGWVLLESGKLAIEEYENTKSSDGPGPECLVIKQSLGS